MYIFNSLSHNNLSSISICLYVHKFHFNILSYKYISHPFLLMLTEHLLGARNCAQGLRIGMQMNFKVLKKEPTHLQMGTKANARSMFN